MAIMPASPPTISAAGTDQNEMPYSTEKAQTH